MLSTLRKFVPLFLALGTTTCKDGTSPPTDELVQMVIDFCDSFAPEFLAVQSGAGGAWVPITGTASATYTLNVPPTFAMAVVYQGGQTFDAEVLYVARDDLAFLDGHVCEESPAFNHSISGSVTGLTASQAAVVTAYDALEFLTAAQNTFQFDGLPSMPLDVIATRETNEVTDRVILRRNVSASATSTPAFDFAATESFAPATNTLALSNTGSTDFIDVDRYFLSSLFATHPLSATENSPTSWSFTSVPTAQTVEGDLQLLVASGIDLNIQGTRTVQIHFRAPGDLTTALGPHLTQPIVSFSGTPQRPRVQLTSQLEYQGNALAIITQGAKSVLLAKTTGFDGATPAVWDMEFPDLSGVTGFPGGGLTAGQAIDWLVTATNAPFGYLASAAPTEGLIVKAADRVSFGSALSGSRPAARLLGSRMRGVRRGW